MSKLITARKGYKKPRNGPLFALGVDRVNNNIFKEGGGLPSMTDVWTNLANTAGVDDVNTYKNSTGNNWFGISKKNNPFSKGNMSRGSTMSSGAKAAIGAGATLVGGLANKGISGGLSSTAGTMVSTLGSTAGNIVGLFNPIAGAAVTLGSQLVGGLTNRAFGMKTNAAALNAANLGTTALNNFRSNALTFDDVHGPTAVASVQDAYKGGWFSGRKARRKNAELRALRAIAQSWANRSVDNNVINLRQDQMNNALANYAALGGWLGGIDPTSPIGYSMLTDMEKILQDKVNSKNMSTIPSILAFGGNVEANGATWSDGMTHINVGGSHEENPNEGVQLGVDNEGTPNLVEEGEVIYNDYVFSNRLTVPVIKKKKDLSQEERVLKKYSDNTYAKAAKKAEKDSGVADRPNDAIAKRGFEATLEILATSQEREREKEKLQELQESIDLMSPEELAMLQQQMTASQQQANQQAMAEQQQLMIPQGMELMQYPMEEQQPIAALGGLLNGWNPVNRFDDGGTIYQRLFDALGVKDLSGYVKLLDQYPELANQLYGQLLLSNMRDPYASGYSIDDSNWASKVYDLAENYPDIWNNIPEEERQKVLDYTREKWLEGFNKYGQWAANTYNLNPKTAVDLDTFLNTLADLYKEAEYQRSVPGYENSSLETLYGLDIIKMNNNILEAIKKAGLFDKVFDPNDPRWKDVLNYYNELTKAPTNNTEEAIKEPEVTTLAVVSEVAPPVVEPVVETPVTTSSTPATITRELSQEELDRVLKGKEFENWWNDALDKEWKYNEQKGTDFGSIYKYITGKDDLSKSGEVYNALRDLYAKDSSKFKEYNAEQARKIASSSDTSTVQQEEEKITPTVTTPKVEKPLEETTASKATIEGPEAEVLDWYNRNNDTKLNADAWSKLSDRKRDRYIKLYKNSLKDKAKKEDFDNRLNAYNQQQDYKKQVEDWQTKLNNSYLSKEDLNKFRYKDLERIAKVVNPKYENKNLAGLSVNDEKKAVEDLRDNIVNWSKDNENGTVEAINNAFSAPNAHENWARTLLDDETRWTPSGYDYDEFAKRTAAYNGSLTLGNTAGKYAPDSNFNLGDFKDVRALEADLNYLDYTTAVENAINNNRNVRWRPKDITKQGLNNLEFEDSNNTFNLEDYDLLRALNNQVTRTKTNPDGNPIPIIDIDENGWMSFNDNSAKLFRDSRNDGILGAMHLTPIKRKASELYTLDDKDYYSLTDIEDKTPNWRDLYTEAPLTTTLDDGTIVHKLSYNDPLKIDRADSLPDGIKKNDDGTYSSKNDTESDSFPKALNWPYLAAGLALLGALGYNILSPSDYSNANAMIKAGMQAGNYMPVSYTPRGNFHRFIPKDPWFFTSPIMAQSNATQRLLANKVSPSKGAEQIANSYMNQLAIGNATRQQLESNDADEFKKKEANNALGNTWSEGFLKADMANQDAFARAQGFSLEGQKAGYAMKQAIDDAKAAGINAGINGIVGLGLNYALNKYNQDVIKWQLEHNQYPISLMPDGRYKLNSGLKTDKDGYIISAEGGKIQRAKKNKRKGLNF